MMNRIRRALIAATIVALLPTFRPAQGKIGGNAIPVADAGLTRYTAADPVQLDGTTSYDPDESGPLTWAWRQVSGPTVVIHDANTPTPRVSGPLRLKYWDPIDTFIQTDETQVCEFELVVSDGVATSRADRVQVVIVPDFGENGLKLANPSFDPDKPTLIRFSGGDCTFGYPPDGGTSAPLLTKYNVITFPNGYRPDRGSFRTYQQVGDMVIVYLSAVAPAYEKPIQTTGFSTGGQPAVDVALRLNLTYKDARYAVNRVTLFDAASYCRDYSESIAAFIAGSVDGESCWLENLVSTDGGRPAFHPGVLTVEFELENHWFAHRWHERCDTTPDSPMNDFNGGVVAGAFVGVAGPARNLQLAFTPETFVYWFRWCGNDFTGHMEMKDESLYPGRLPEPVTLLGPEHGATVDAAGAVLSCAPSENAVGYQLLFGADPSHMVYLYSDTPAPPDEPVTVFPFEQTWWTIRARDRFGTTIHADPRSFRAVLVKPQPIENPATGRRYPSIQAAVNDALDGDVVLVTPGLPYLETIDFKGKTVTLQSTDPSTPALTNTIIIGGKTIQSGSSP
jgi:hypothetical protein